MEMPFGEVITSRSNARVKALRASFSGEARKPGELVGIEGEHLIGEALRSDHRIDAVFLREGSEWSLARSTLAGLDREKIVVLSAEVFDSAMDTASPQGIAAMVEIAWPNAGLSSMTGPVLVLESLQDPGNLGTLIRSAAAFDSTMVYLTTDCVNYWIPKVIRASAGAVFHIPIFRGVLAEQCRILKETERRIFAAVAPRSGANSVYETYLGDPCAIMIGNEGAGLSAEAIALADDMVTIPCEVESLNAAVAGSVLLYEAMRQRYVKAGKD